MFRLLFVLALLASLLPIISAPRAVHACSGGFPSTDPQERFSMLLQDNQNPVVLAEITGVEPIPNGGQPGPPFLLQPGSTIATFKPVVAWSNVPLTGRTIGPLGYTGADCSGGPALQPGDKVLLFLAPRRPYQPVADYTIGVFGDTVLFRGNEAFYASPNHLEPAGATGEVLQALLGLVRGSDAATTEASRFLGIDAAAVAPRPAGELAPIAPSRIVPPAAGDAGLR